MYFSCSSFFALFFFLSVSPFFITPVPVFFSFPCPPVFLQPFIGNALMPGPKMMTVIRRQAEKGTRHPGRSDIYPAPVVAAGPEPMSQIFTVPVAVVKEDVRFNIGDKIDGCTRYVKHCRRSGDYNRGRDVYSYVDIYARNTRC